MDLLPKLDELLPIKEGPFTDCGFSTSFSDLSLEKQLQILCDIVRQSIYPNGIPNPDNDIENMNGNCFTASYCFLDYIKRLNIGYNPRCVLARKRKFDGADVTTIHTMVLVDSLDGQIYQVDPTPFAGYKYGFVEEISKLRVYDEYVVIDDFIKEYLYSFRKIIYDNSVRQVDVSKLDKYFKMCDIVEDIPILKGYAAIVLKILMKYVDNEYDKNQIKKRIDNIKPYNKNNESKLMEARERLNMQTLLWLDELKKLQVSSSNIKRQLELAINCVQENKWIDTSLEKYIDIGGKLIRASSINPRFFSEEEFILLLSNRSLNKGEKKLNFFGEPLFSCHLNLFAPTEHTGIYPLLYSLYYSNDSDIEINDKQIMLYKTSDLPNNYKELLDENFKLLDSPVECSLEFLTPYPEHQVMTRFMYPNPRLIKCKKK
jgi:hypothetical protein